MDRWTDTWMAGPLMIIPCRTLSVKDDKHVAILKAYIHSGLGLLICDFHFYFKLAAKGHPATQNVQSTSLPIMSMRAEAEYRDRV